MIELPPDIEEQLREQAARRGQAVEDYLLQFLKEPLNQNGNHNFADGIKRPREADSTYLLSLPKAERDRIMTAQFDAAAPLYELGLPSLKDEERFTK